MKIIKKIKYFKEKYLGISYEEKKRLKKVLKEASLSDKYKLIKNHKNNTRLLYNKDLQKFLKFNSSAKSKKKILNEYYGYKWYFSIVQKNSERRKFLKIINKKNKKFLLIKKINGLQIKSWKPLSENYVYIIKVYRHYKKHFLDKNIKFIHGDLTLDNIIFNSKKTTIIDWEFYSPNCKYIGLDLAYFFLSSISIPYAASKKLEKKDVMLFKNLWLILFKENINKKILNNPFNFFQKHIMNNNKLREAYKISKKKFFPFTLDKKFENKVLKIINEL